MQLQKDLLFADHYTLLQRIGRGGFSEVWLAEDKYTRLQIAIKVYAPEGGMDEQGVEAFSSEIARVYNLNHSNILKPQHFDVWQNMPYLVLPYCSNGSCMKWMGNMTEQQIWELIEQIGSGLSYLHRHNIIHQDIKPDNILIDAQGDYVLTDFGISTHARNTMRRIDNSNGMEDPSAGTRPYMAPERFGKDKMPVKASDIWALGATIFELMVGEVPFGDGVLPGGLLQMNGAQIPELPEKYSLELRSFVGQMLSLQPWDRPTAEQLVKVANDPNHVVALSLSTANPTPTIPQGVAQTAPMQVSAAQASTQPSQPKSNKRLWSIIAILIAILAVVGFGIGWWLSQRTTYLRVNDESECVQASLMASGGEFVGTVDTDGKHFKVKSVPEWVSVVYSPSSFTLSYGKNPDKCVREATLEVVSGGKSMQLFLSQSFRQAKFVKINDKEEVFAHANMNGGVLHYSITTDGDIWEVASQPEWCDVTCENNTLNLSFDANMSDDVRSGKLIVRADDKNALLTLSQPSKPRYEQEKLERERRARAKEMEDKAYMNITKIEFQNVENDGTVISSYGSSLVNDKMRYLKPKLHYTGLDNTADHEITLYFRDYPPGSSTYLSGSSSPSGYTYSQSHIVMSGNNTVTLSGYGNSSQSVYPAGTGRFEIWYNGKKIHTASYTITASQNSYSSSSSYNTTDIKSWITKLFGWSSYSFKSTSIETCSRKINSEFGVSPTIKYNGDSKYFGESISGPSLDSHVCKWIFLDYDSSSIYVKYEFRCSTSSDAENFYAKLKAFFEQYGALFKNRTSSEESYSSTDIVINGYTLERQSVGKYSSTNTVYITYSIKK